MKPIHFAININYDCNRSCSTCYYPHKSERMGGEVAEKVGAWIANMLHSYNSPYFRIDFLGGEPTLNLDAVEAIINTVTKKKPEYTNLAIAGLRIYTNGDFLIPDVLKRLRDLELYIMLNPTYDSLDDINKKLKAIKEINFFHSCSLAVALDEANLERLPELAKLVLSYKGHIRPNRLYNGGVISGYVDRYREQMEKMFDVLLEAERPMIPNFLMEGFPPVLSALRPPEAEVSPHPCGHWYFSVDPNGRVRSCNPDLTTEIGDISKKDFIFSHNKFEALSECLGCKWEYLCRSGCPYTRKLAYGTYDRKSPFCEAFKELYPKLMELVKKWEKRKI